MYRVYSSGNPLYWRGRACSLFGWLSMVCTRVEYGVDGRMLAGSIVPVDEKDDSLLCLTFFFLNDKNNLYRVMASTIRRVNADIFINNHIHPHLQGKSLLPD